MTVTDVFIHPFPKGDSTLLRMADTASAFGYDTVVAIGHPNTEIKGVRVLNGTIVHEKSLKAVNAAVRKRTYDIIGVQAGENSFNRSVIQTDGVHLLTDLFQTQRNAFDHVTAKLAAKRHIAIHLDIGRIIVCHGHMRQKVLSRYRELLALQRKFGFSFALGSGAESILGQRSVREMVLLAELFGMTEDETIQALGTVPDLFSGSDLPKVIR
ncbi:MAG: ribonuclease P [Methanocalculus sp. MSAO_Arc1]|uniref:RNase P subunit p30 family protein n=1 Tax=Methanocalculus TaxID=71151 RepID=UPI000FEE377B|nr:MULTISPECIES: RNase P subunit p30 family protein [unclassified Methanocalculus]MCP1663119.1 ribonuclease P/MRP protein subunit RPP1 [Methanocalculus sp. AMF5]RQD81582.1 MAG: ribonuclease P [Methanocalculus sp. MSAO_Arc1]